MKTLTGLALLLPTALLAAACGSSATGSSSNAAATGSSTLSGASGNTVVFAGPGGASEAIFSKLAQTFKQQTGITVEYQAVLAGPGYAQIQAEQASPKIDVFFANANNQAKADASDLFEPVNTTLIPNLSQLYAANPPTKYGVLLAYNGEGIVYNTAAFAKAGIPAPTSLNDFFNPKLKGHVAIYPSSGNFGINALVDFAYSAGGSVNNIGPGFAKLKELKEDGNWAYSPASPAEGASLLQSQAVWIAYDSIKDASLAQAQGEPIGWVNPNDPGGTLDPAYLDIVRNAPHAAAAAKWVNFLISADVQKQEAVVGYQGPSNKTVVLPADLASKVPYGAPLKTYLVVNSTTVAENTPTWITQWQQQFGE